MKCKNRKQYYLLMDIYICCRKHTSMIGSDTHHFQDAGFLWGKEKKEIGGDFSCI